MARIILPESRLDGMVSHCRSAYPNEACGILSGKGEVAEKIYAITNIEPSNVSYLMDPAEQFRAMKEIRSRGDRMTAIFHSHPGSPAYPSPKDVELAFYPDCIYIIVSFTDFDRPEIRAFEIRDEVVADAQIEFRQP